MDDFFFRAVISTIVVSIIVVGAMVWNVFFRH